MLLNLYQNTFPQTKKLYKNNIPFQTITKKHSDKTLLLQHNNYLLLVLFI